MPLPRREDPRTHRDRHLCLLTPNIGRAWTLAHTHISTVPPYQRDLRTLSRRRTCVLTPTSEDKRTLRRTHRFVFTQPKDLRMLSRTHICVLPPTLGGIDEHFHPPTHASFIPPVGRINGRFHLHANSATLLPWKRSTDASAYIYASFPHNGEIDERLHVPHIFPLPSLRGI